MAFWCVQTHLSMSFFVQFWQQPHHDTDSTWMYNDAVSHFQPAVKRHILITINNSKESLKMLQQSTALNPMFQQSTALNPPSSNRAQHWKLSKQYKWPRITGSLLWVTKTCSSQGPAHPKMCSSLFKQTLLLKVFAEQKTDNQRNRWCISPQPALSFYFLWVYNFSYTVTSVL